MQNHFLLKKLSGNIWRYFCNDSHIKTIETLFAGGTANTRMRDFYDLFADEIAVSPDMMALWKSYQRKFEYAADIGWDVVVQAVRKLCDMIK